MHTVPQGQWYRGGVHVFYEGSWHVQLNFGVLVSVSVSERVPEEYLTYCCSTVYSSTRVRLVTR